MIYELKLNFPNVNNCKLIVEMNDIIVDFIHITSNQFIFNNRKMHGYLGMK